MKTKRAPDRANQRRRTASDYIQPWTTIQPGDRVVITCRVSTDGQRDNGDLAEQCEFLMQEVLKGGAEIVGDKWHVGPGQDPSWLESAAREAKEFDAKLIAESTDRFVRHRDCDKWHQYLQATNRELECLRRYTLGVTLVTFLAPDAQWQIVRGHQSRRGQLMKGCKGGRPTKTRRRPKSSPGWKTALREELAPIVLEFYNEGWTQRAIARELGLPPATINLWLKSRQIR